MGLVPMTAIPWTQNRFRTILAITLLFSLVAVTLGSPMSTSAGGGRPAATIAIRTTTKTVAPGSTFTLDVALDMQSGSHEISVATLLLGFDASVLQATSFVPL